MYGPPRPPPPGMMPGPPRFYGPPRPRPPPPYYATHPPPSYMRPPHPSGYYPPGPGYRPPPYRPSWGPPRPYMPPGPPGPPGPYMHSPYMDADYQEYPYYGNYQEYPEPHTSMPPAGTPVESEGDTPTPGTPKVLLPTPPTTAAESSTQNRTILDAPGQNGESSENLQDLMPKDESEDYKLKMLAVQAAAYKSSNIGSLVTAHEMQRSQMEAAWRMPNQMMHQHAPTASMQTQQPVMMDSMPETIPLPAKKEAERDKKPARIDPERINEELLKGTLESLEALRKEEVEFERTTSEWIKSYETWLESNKNHPNQEQFKQYQDQCTSYKRRMETKKASMRERKAKLLDILNNRNRMINKDKTTEENGSDTNVSPVKEKTHVKKNADRIERNPSPPPKEVKPAENIERKRPSLSASSNPPRSKGIRPRQPSNSSSDDDLVERPRFRRRIERSKSRSPAKSREKKRSRSRSREKKRSRSRSLEKKRSRSSSLEKKRSRSRSRENKKRSRSRSRSPSSSRSNSRSLGSIHRRRSPSPSKTRRYPEAEGIRETEQRRSYEAASYDRRAYDRDSSYNRGGYGFEEDRGRYSGRHDYSHGAGFRTGSGSADLRRVEDYNARDVDLRYHDLDSARPYNTLGDIDHRRMEGPTVQSFDYGHQSRPINPSVHSAPQVIDYGHGRSPWPRAPAPAAPYESYDNSRMAYLRSQNPVSTFPHHHPHQDPPLRRSSPFREEARGIGTNPPAPPVTKSATELFPAGQASLFPAASHPTMQSQPLKQLPVTATAAEVFQQVQEAAQPKIEVAVLPIDNLLYSPARQQRPERILIILRGLPGVGKSHMCRLIREKEQENGGAAPRILSLDDYFAGDEEDNDISNEEAYREQLFRSFKRQVDDGYFLFIILDAVNVRVKDFMPFHDYAKKKAFQVYVTHLQKDLSVCLKRNIHGRTMFDLNRLSMSWEPTPKWLTRLDVSSLLQEADIEHVEMEDVETTPNMTASQEDKNDDEDDGDDGVDFLRSKWDNEAKEERMERLDGLRKFGSGHWRPKSPVNMAEYLELDLESDLRDDGKKHVRWADLEEMKAQTRRKRLGFVIGQTDWHKLLSDDSEVADQALNRTKYF